MIMTEDACPWASSETIRHYVWAIPISCKETTSRPPNARQLKPADGENHSSPKQAAPNQLRKFLRLEMHQAKLPANQGWKY